MSGAVVVRPAARSDSRRITEIYNEGIRGGGATFETREREEADVLAWFDRPRYPVLVAEHEGEVVGWISGSPYRTRDCYAGISEFSVYVDAGARGRGIGDALMGALLPALEAAGFWKVLSRIFPENRASLALCERHGFREVGLYRRHGKLGGEWRDVVIVERLLGPDREEG